MTPPRPFQVMIKPTGAACNLACRYCYYLEKAGLYPDSDRMPDEVLREVTRQYIEANPASEVEFVWQGGEPTLLGVDFFRRAVEYQREFSSGRTIRNSIQTNGTLLDDDWGRFLAENRFLVGLSLDGPAELHDANRRTRGGQGSHERAMNGLRLLRRHGVEVNALGVVSAASVGRPLDVYRFFRDEGVQFVQFIPVVEREAGAVTPWSVPPEAYGEFLVAVFDEWVRRDVGRVFVQLFDVALNAWVGRRPPLCWFNETCGSALVVERNGDVYACDHFVYPEYRRGNLLERPLGEIARDAAQVAFGAAKAALPAYCDRCTVRFACRGECPKRRFTRTPDGEPGLNALCPAYKRFFRHADPYLRRMAELLSRGRAPAEIMRELDSGRPLAPSHRRPGPKRR